MELLERERCLAALGQWLGSALAHGGCIALLSGEAGIGKTVLLQEFAARQDRIRVLWGSCDALFTPRPLAPLHDIAGQTQGRLLAAVNSAASPSALFSAALDELERTPSLVVFEDLHWADEATLDLLMYLGRRIRRTRSMLAATCRDDELGARHPLRLVMGELPRASTHRISLEPLSEAAVAELARRAGQSAKGLHRITGGNPFFVTEVLAAALDSVPVTVRDAVLARAARLSPAARELAELVCVIPGKVEPWLLEQAAHPDPDAIEGCLGLGMVRDEDSALSFRHELARRALEAALAQPRRRTLHGRVLEILAAREGVPAARLAHHADAAGSAPAVLRYAPLAAAQAAAVGAHREAASHYRLALRYAGELPAVERARLQEQLAYECYLTGEYEAAIETRRAALGTWRALGHRLQEGDALRWLARLSWYAGDGEQARKDSLDAIATLESLPPGPELARAYCDQADLDMEAHEEDPAIAWAQRAIALAEPWDNNEILSDALGILGLVRLIAGDTCGWVDLNRSLERALAGGLQERVAVAYSSLAAMAISRRQYEQAAAYTAAGLSYCEERDLDFTLPYMLAYRARMRFEQADWNGASEDLEAVLRHPHATPVTRIPALRTLAHLRVRRGDPGVSAAVEEARALAGAKPELQRVGMLAAVCAEAAWLTGDRDGVVREVQPVFERARGRRDPRMNGELAAWLYRVKALAVQPEGVAEPYALEISGDWRSAAGAWKALGCPYEHACLLGWHGSEADQRQALALFEQLGARPAAQALRRQMRERGVRRIPHGSRTSTRGHPFGLTRREAEILVLLAEGLRNAGIAKRLFVAPKTVEHHISAILAKLGVSSRAAAVALTRKETNKRS
jgi:DNA-binding CsgD family transcriptional regulator